MVLLSIVHIRKSVLKLIGNAKVKIPKFPKGTRNVKHYYISENFDNNGEQFIFSFKCYPALKEGEMKKMMVSCSVCSPNKGVEMEMPIMNEAVDTVIDTIDAEETVNKCIKIFEELLHDVEDFDPEDDDRFNFDG